MLGLEPSLLALLSRLRFSPEAQRQHRSGGPGAHLSKGRGQSLDFSEYRPYQPGDDLRTLDWKVYGRSDRLYTKLYVPEQEETIHLVLDASGSMREKWAFLQRAALGLSTIALSQGDRLAITFLTRREAPTPLGLTPLRGRSALARIARLLESIQPAGICELESSLEEFARRHQSRSHVVVVSDFLQPGAGSQGLRRLHARRHRVTVLQLLSPAEIQPERVLSLGAWELFDPEPTTPDPQGGTVRLDLGHASFAAYQQEFAAHQAELERTTRLLGAQWSSSSVELPLTRYFSETLRQAGVLQ